MNDKFLADLERALNTIRESVLETTNLPSPVDVIKCIRDSGIKFVVIGAHGIYKHTQKLRATIDVVIIVSDIKKATKIIGAKWPELKIVDYGSKISFEHGGHEIIDLVKPTQPIYKLALDNTENGTPTLAMALSLKFAAMVSPNRKPDEKVQDAADFKIMVLKNEVDIKKVISLVDASLYNGAGQEAGAIITDIKAGKPISI